MDISFKNGNTLTVSEILEAKKILDKEIKIEGEELIGLSKPAPSHIDITAMLKFYGIDGDRVVQCPECKMISPIRYVITHLNDSRFSHTYSSMKTLKDKGDKLWTAPGIQAYENHAWTFKQMGQWLEGLGY